MTGANDGMIDGKAGFDLSHSNESRAKCVFFGASCHRFDTRVQGCYNNGKVKIFSDFILTCALIRENCEFKFNVAKVVHSCKKL